MNRFGTSRASARPIPAGSRPQPAFAWWTERGNASQVRALGLRVARTGQEALDSLRAVHYMNAANRKLAGHRAGAENLAAARCERSTQRLRSGGARGRRPWRLVELAPHRRRRVRCKPSGSSSVGRALAFQAGCRGFEPRLPLQFPSRTIRACRRAPRSDASASVMRARSTWSGPGLVALLVGLATLRTSKDLGFDAGSRIRRDPEPARDHAPGGDPRPRRLRPRARRRPAPGPRRAEPPVRFRRRGAHRRDGRGGPEGHAAPRDARRRRRLPRSRS